MQKNRKTKNHLELLYIKGNVNFATLDEQTHSLLFDLLHLDFVELLLRWHQYKLSGESIEESSVEYVILDVKFLVRL
jgi:hypothetical protein